MLRLIAALAGLILLVAIIWASMTANIWESGSMLIADPWGLVTLIDLYAGFILMSVVIFLFEKSSLQRLLWILPLYVLGNVWSALWLILRWQTIIGRFSTARSAA